VPTAAVKARLSLPRTCRRPGAGRFSFPRAAAGPCLRPAACGRHMPRPADGQTDGRPTSGRGKSPRPAPATGAGSVQNSGRRQAASRPAAGCERLRPFCLLSAGSAGCSSPPALIPVVTLLQACRIPSARMRRPAGQQGNRAAPARQAHRHAEQVLSGWQRCQLAGSMQSRALSTLHDIPRLAASARLATSSNRSRRPPSEANAVRRPMAST
jgi:hypothetical protein